MPNTVKVSVGKYRKIGKDGVTAQRNGSATTFVDEVSQIVSEKTGAMISNIFDSAQDRYEIGRNFVRKNPMKGVAIAAGMGLITGSLLTVAMLSKK